jgi:hypothetical protein
MSKHNNRYTRLDDNTWGAWIDTGYGRTAIAKPTVGSTVTIKTKSGEEHSRIVSKIVADYKSGVIVSLIPDAEVAAKANERYQAKVDASNAERAAKRQEQAARIWDNINNEGYSDAGQYNPYRNYDRALRSDCLSAAM